MTSNDQISVGVQAPQRATRNPGLELFFDLVFVLCVAQLAALVHDDPSWRSALTALLLFVPVWWTWTGVTFVLNRFPRDDNTTNIALLLAAGASGMMALAVPDTPGSGNDWFALGYAAVRIILALMYLRSRTGGERLASFYAAGFAATAVVWLVSIALPHAVQPFVWGGAMVIDILIPALADRAQRILPVDEEHLPDRFSAFAIIVLGEAAVSPVAVAHDRLDATVIAVLAAGFVVAALMWWGFFDRRAWQLRYRLLADHDNSGRIAYILCAYLHFPLVAGIAAVAAGIEIAVEGAGERVSAACAITLVIGIAAYLATLNVMTWVLGTPKRASVAWWRTGLLVLLGLWLLLGRGQTSPVFLAGCLVVLLLHTLINIGREQGWPVVGPRPAEVGAQNS